MSVEKIYRAEIPDGTHLDRSRATDGAYRGLLRDDENNLVGHLDLVEVDEVEETEWDSEYPDDDLLDLKGILTVVGVVGAAVGGGVLASRWWKSREAKRQEQQAELEAAVSEEHQARSEARTLPPADWYEDPSGRLRWWDGLQWTEHVKAHGANQVDTNGEVAYSAHAVQSTEANARRGQASVTMSSAEWQERVRAMLLARAFSEEQWRLLADADIQDADPATLEGQRELRSLTPQQFSDRIQALLARNPDLFQGASLAAPLGWYDDGSGCQRWWDGRQWTGHVQPALVEAIARPSTYAPPGWHDDGSGRQRWWDGNRWTDYWA